MIWRLAGLVIAGLLAYAGLQAAWRAVALHPAARQAPPPAEPAAGNAPPQGPGPSPHTPSPEAVPPAPAPVAVPVSPCGPAPAFAEAAARNAASLDTAAWSAFGPPSAGWAIYAALAAHEAATACGPAEAGFAAALAAWQGAHGLPANGVMDEPTLRALYGVWTSRRPFVAATAHGGCPPPPEAFRLAFALPAEGYSGKPIQLRTRALAAYRRMAEAARRDLPSLAADKRLLTIFSGYRGPAEEAARCADGGCNTTTKASCSAHRTGLALDLYLGAAPGFAPESSADPNRLFQTRTPLYRWLVANAARFGFVPYPVEPWHWEWTGEPP